VSVVTKSGERQRRSGVSKRRYGVGTSTSSCWLALAYSGWWLWRLRWYVAKRHDGCSGDTKCTGCKTRNDLGNSMPPRPGMVAGRSVVDVDGHNWPSGRYVVIFNRYKTAKSRREWGWRCSLPSQRHLPRGRCLTFLYQVPTE